MKPLSLRPCLASWKTVFVGDAVRMAMATPVRTLFDCCVACIAHNVDALHKQSFAFALIPEEVAHHTTLYYI